MFCTWSSRRTILRACRDASRGAYLACSVTTWLRDKRSSFNSSSNSFRLPLSRVKEMRSLKAKEPWARGLAKSNARRSSFSAFHVRYSSQRLVLQRPND